MDNREAALRMAKLSCSSLLSSILSLGFVSGPDSTKMIFLLCGAFSPASKQKREGRDKKNV